MGCQLLRILLGLILAAAVSLGAAATSPGLPDSPDQAAIQEAARWIQGEARIETEYRYVMTAKLRLLLFWAGRDDVGGGYIRIGKAPGQGGGHVIHILFGSDPAKAPLSCFSFREFLPAYFVCS